MNGFRWNHVRTGHSAAPGAAYPRPQKAHGGESIVPPSQSLLRVLLGPSATVPASEAEAVVWPRLRSRQAGVADVDTSSNYSGGGQIESWGWLWSALEAAGRLVRLGRSTRTRTCAFDSVRVLVLIGESRLRHATPKRQPQRGAPTPRIQREGPRDRFEFVHRT